MSEPEPQRETEQCKVPAGPPQEPGFSLSVLSLFYFSSPVVEVCTGQRPESSVQSLPQEAHIGPLIAGGPFQVSCTQNWGDKGALCQEAPSLAAHLHGIYMGSFHASMHTSSHSMASLGASTETKEWALSFKCPPKGTLTGNRNLLRSREVA